MDETLQNGLQMPLWPEKISLQLALGAVHSWLLTTPQQRMCPISRPDRAVGYLSSRQNVCTLRLFLAILAPPTSQACLHKVLPVQPVESMLIEVAAKLA
jgi:hypothetical protein